MRPRSVLDRVGPVRRAVRGETGACGRVLLACTLAGGVAWGGVLVGTLTVLGHVTPGFQLLAAPVLFVVGSLLGLVHGVVLSLAGRADTLTLRGAAHLDAFALLLLPLGLVAAWIVTASITVTAAVVVERRLATSVVAAAGWIGGIVLCVWAAFEIGKALGRAAARYPSLRVAGLAAVGSLPLLLVALVVLRPPVPGTTLQVGAAAAVVLALALAAWGVLPLTCLVVHLVRRARRASPEQAAAMVLNGLPLALLSVLIA